jgi:hypothetical protein
MTQTHRKKSFYVEIIYQHKLSTGVEERFIYLFSYPSSLQTVEALLPNR